MALLNGLPDGVGNTVGRGVVVEATAGCWDAEGDVVDGWTTGGVDVMGVAGPLPRKSHDILVIVLYTGHIGIASI